MKVLLILILVNCLIATDVSYSELIANKAAQLSAAVYKVTKEDYEKNKCPECYTGFKIRTQLIGTDILALVGVDKTLKNIVVIFRGSSNVANFFTDALAVMENYGNQQKCKQCKVHFGFKQAYDSLVQKGLQVQIKKAIKKYSSYGILFTGHSLGGALAVLASVKFVQANQKFKNLNVYTFGQPRVGNQKFARYSDQLIPNHFRVVNKKDIVPHKAAHFVFYRHSGFEIWYKDGVDKDYYGCKGDTNHCSNSIGNSNFKFTVEDHHSSNYIGTKGQGKNLFETFKEGEEGEKIKKKIAKSEHKAQLEDGHIAGSLTDIFEDWFEKLQQF